MTQKALREQGFPNRRGESAEEKNRYFISSDELFVVIWMWEEGRSGRENKLGGC